MLRGHSFNFGLLRIEFVEILLTELEKSEFGYQYPKGLSIVENSICFFMLLGDIKMKFNYGYKYFVENEPENLGEHFLASPDDLIFKLVIELKIQPRNLKYVHPMKIIFHSKIFIPLHLYEFFHH